MRSIVNREKVYLGVRRRPFMLISRFKVAGTLHFFEVTAYRKRSKA